MGRYVDGKTGEEVQVTPAQDQTYKALEKAANRMGNNNYLEQKAKWLKTHKNMKKFQFTVTAEHEMIVKAMPKVLSGELTPEEAMSLLWDYDVLKQRLG